MSDFHRDDAWQKGMRDAILAPHFYGKYAMEGRYVFVDKGRLATLLQKRYAVDTICQGRGGRAVCIEEKIVRWPGYVYSAYTLETQSCTKPGRESDGWMVYGEADYLLYCFATENNDLNCHLIDFPRLKKWFWPRLGRFHDFGPLPTLNATNGKKVPIIDVDEAGLIVWRRLVSAGRAAA